MALTKDDIKEFHYCSKCGSVPDSDGWCFECKDTVYEYSKKDNYIKLSRLKEELKLIMQESCCCVNICNKNENDECKTLKNLFNEYFGEVLKDEN